MLRCRKSGVLTGLPDGYGRGALSVTTAAWRCMASVIWCVTRTAICRSPVPSGKRRGSGSTIRLREELAEHRHALLQIQEWRRNMALISLARRRMRRKRAVALLRLPGGSEIAKWRRDVLGRTASFLDIYIERDFKAGDSMSSRHRN